MPEDNKNNLEKSLAANQTQEMNNCTQEELSEVAIKNAINLIKANSAKRLKLEELVALSGQIVNFAILQSNRCAIINGMALMLSNMGLAHELISIFFEMQFNPNIDCGECKLCEQRRERESLEEEIIMVHEGTKTIH